MRVRGVVLERQELRNTVAITRTHAHRTAVVVAASKKVTDPKCVIGVWSDSN